MNSMAWVKKKCNGCKLKHNLYLQQIPTITFYTINKLGVVLTTRYLISPNTFKTKYKTVGIIIIIFYLALSINLSTVLKQKEHF